MPPPGLYFPAGYICSQIPGAALIQAKGPKLILGLTMVGTCGVFMALPLLARLGRTTAASVRIMAGCLTLCGFFQVRVSNPGGLPVFNSIALGHPVRDG